MVDVSVETRTGHIPYVSTEILPPGPTFLLRFIWGTPQSCSSFLPPLVMSVYQKQHERGALYHVADGKPRHDVLFFPSLQRKSHPRPCDDVHNGYDDKKGVEYLNHWCSAFTKIRYLLLTHFCFKLPWHSKVSLGVEIYATRSGYVT